MVGTPQTIELKGERFVVIPEAEYEQLREASDLPPLPPADEDGYRPALEFIDSTIARDTIRDRKALGLSQQDLADLAGVRQETISRLESGKHSPTVRTLEKIEAALKQAAKKRRRSRP